MRSLVIGAVLGASGTAGAVQVDFERDAYAIMPGQSLVMRVLIDYEGRDPESLFSYGLRLTSAPGAGVTVSSIEVPPELDYYGLSGSAERDLSPGVWGVKGHVAWGGANYTGSLIATYVVEFAQPGIYDLGLALFQTFGPDEDLFVDGDGVDFDNDLMPFGTTRVVVGSVEAPTLALQRLPSGDIDLSFQTFDQIPYTIRTTVDLQEWSDLVMVTGDGTLFSYRHVNGGTANQRFYQVVSGVPGGS